LTLDAARQVADAAAAFARRAGAPGASIAIVDSGGHLLFMERLDGTYPASAGLAADKARTAALFRRPSRALEDATDAGRASLVTMGYVLVRGAVPITWKGAVVGAIGVSGAAGAWQDEEIALAGLRATFGGK
jgi:glc operon protein GlcG